MQHLSQNLHGRSVLITGGSGYIGRVASLMLEHWGCTVWCLDDLSGGPKPKKLQRFIEGSILDLKLLSTLFQNHHFDAVIHLAGKISVGESIEKPEFYWLHNVIGTQNILSSIPRDTDILFASSAAVYGSCIDRVTEHSVCVPTSPYGNGKRAAEKAILDSPNNSICFRLFNVAGAIRHPNNPDLLVGEERQPETHLIPRVIQQHLNGRSFSVFGQTYDTEDGTCIREYIHVLDVVQAFATGMCHLRNTPSASSNRYTFNLSSGLGHSVLEVLQTISLEGAQMKQTPIEYDFVAPRDGDPSCIAGDISHIRNILDWKPTHSNLASIVRSTWQHQLMLRQNPPTNANPFGK